MTEDIERVHVSLVILHLLQQFEIMPLLFFLWGGGGDSEHEQVIATLLLWLFIKPK